MAPPPVSRNPLSRPIIVRALIHPAFALVVSQFANRRQRRSRRHSAAVTAPSAPAPSARAAPYPSAALGHGQPPRHPSSSARGVSSSLAAYKPAGGQQQQRTVSGSSWDSEGVISYQSSGDEAGSGGEEAWGGQEEGRVYAGQEVAMGGVEEAVDWGSAWAATEYQPAYDHQDQTQQLNDMSFDVTTFYSDSLAPSPDPSALLLSSSPHAPPPSHLPQADFAFSPSPTTSFSSGSIFSPAPLAQPFHSASAPSYLQGLDLSLDALAQGVTDPNFWGNILTHAELEGGMLEVGGVTLSMGGC